MEEGLAFSLLAAEAAALAVAAIWIGLRVRHEGRRAAVRIGRALGPRPAQELELQAPFSQRVLQPLLRSFLSHLGALSPARNVEKLRRQLLIAGSPFGLGALDFLGLRILVTIGGTVLLTLGLASVTGSFVRSLIGAVGAAILFSELPSLWLHRRMARRRNAITLALPDALDMLIVCAEAGLGIEASFLRIGRRWDHDLAREFRRAVMEMGVGMSWREAMRNMVYRTDAPDLSSLVAVLLQADQLGFSIADTLHSQGEQLRIRRRQRAQELARQAPIKMLFPMVFFIMPATFAVVLGPALPAIIEALGRR